MVVAGAGEVSPVAGEEAAGAASTGAGPAGAVGAAPVVGAGLTVIGLVAVAVLGVAAFGAGAGVATIGAEALAFTPASMALAWRAGRTRVVVVREAITVRWVATGAAGWLVVTLCVVAAGVAAVLAAGVAAGSWPALGGAAVFRATVREDVAPGVSCGTPVSWGRLAYQPTAPIAATATTPAAIAPAGTPLRVDRRDAGWVS